MVSGEESSKSRELIAMEGTGVCRGVPNERNPNSNQTAVIVIMSAEKGALIISNLIYGRKG